MKQTFLLVGLGLAFATPIAAAQAQATIQSAQPRLTHVRQSQPKEQPAVRTLAQSATTEDMSGSQGTPTQPRTLFTIGNLPATLWAPVQPPYDGRANRNNNADPLWWSDDAAM